MKNSQWEQVAELPRYVQIPLFDLDPMEVLTYRVKEFEKIMKEKLERQRKGQFGKIGRLEKALSDMQERLEIMERGLCRPDAEILEMEFSQMQG